MLCPACRRNIRPQGRFCPLCGAQVFGLGVGPQPFGPPASPPQPGYFPDPRLGRMYPSPTPPPGPVGPTVPTPPVVDGEAYKGKTCPFCQFVIKPGDRIVTCPHCDIPHHNDCWAENGGCTTFGCAGAHTTAPAQPPYPPAMAPGAPLGPQATYGYGPPVPPPYAAGPYGLPPYIPRYDPTRLATAERMATNALWCAIIGLCCGVLAILGIVFGGMALSELNKLGIRNHPARGRAIAAIVVAAVVLALNAIFTFIGMLAEP